MIVVTVFPLIESPMEFRLVHNQNENYHHNHITFNLKGIGNMFLQLNYKYCVLKRTHLNFLNFHKI